MIKGVLQTEKYRVPEEVLEQMRNATTRAEARLIEEQWIKDNIETGKVEPYNIGEATNIWLTVGKNEILNLITGNSTNHFDYSNTEIGIGDSSTAAAAGQTDLLAATNKTYSNMESGYPTTASSGTIQFRAKFLTSEANYSWAEAVVRQATSAVCWNRAVVSQGTKTNTEIWYELCTIGFS